MNRDVPPPEWQYSTADEEALTLKMAEARELVGRVFPSVAETLEVIIDEFVFAHCPGLMGGSTSGVSGIIWFGMPSSWSSVRLRRVYRSRIHPPVPVLGGHGQNGLFRTCTRNG